MMSVKEREAFLNRMRLASAAMQWNHFLADYIVLQVGYQHWLRMNQWRVYTHVAFDKKAFIHDMMDRAGIRQGRSAPLHPVITYLIMRLIPARLSLPDRYNVKKPIGHSRMEHIDGR